MSNFRNLLKTHKQVHEGTIDEVPPPPPAPVETPTASEEIPTSLPSKKLVEISKKRGRPSGKRSDKAFVQAPAWIRKDTHAEVKIALIRDGNKQEFSELVEILLTKWLKSRT